MLLIRECRIASAAGGSGERAGRTSLHLPSMAIRLQGMTWSFDSGAPRRDSTVPVEVEVALLFAEQPIPLVYKLVRLWRFLTPR